jgi:hypothetical protein
MIVSEERIDSLLSKIQPYIWGKYCGYIKSYQDYIYPASDCPCREVFKKVGFKQMNFDLYSLNLAIDEIVQDIRFIISRRGPLIARDENDELLISRGKIAGVMSFRLNRRQIVHVSEWCLDYNRCKIRCTAKMNTSYALQCGTEFIQTQPYQINKMLLSELFYQMTSRHVNQETLGLLFDTIRLHK